MTSKRTDVHRPEVFEPSDYDIGECFDNNPPEPDGRGMTPQAWAAYRAWRADYMESIRRVFGGRIPHACQHCGTHGLRWIWAITHRPTGEVICMGDDCVRGGRLNYSNHEAFRMKFIMDKASRDAVHFKNLAKRAAWEESNPVAAAFLAQLPDDEPFEFLADLKRKLNLYHELSERQTAAIMRIRDKRIAHVAERKATEIVATGPAPEGRCKVVGVVLKTKSQESQFGEQFRMLVKLEDGNRCWGTVPSGIYGGQGDGPITGSRIEMTATFERSKEDEHFAFYKRPIAKRIESITA